MVKKIGKTQSFSRECNNKFVIDLLRQKPYSGTELSNILSLSDSTISSILKDLLQINFIKVSDTFSNNGLGRKRVLYKINEQYGSILSVCISNYWATVTLSDICENVIEQTDIEIEKYDNQAFESILLCCSKLALSIKGRVAPIRDIIITLPGRVNNVTGELMLSAQFDKELFKEKNYIHNQFSKILPDIPIYVANDINISCLAEMKIGKLKEVKNAIYLSVDTGIGGALVINNDLFEGDLGFAGEFGISFVSLENSCYLDDYVSLRVLRNFANETCNESFRIRDLERLFKENKDVHDEVIKSAHILGKQLLSMVGTLDIQTIIISGRVKFFGDEYLNVIKEELKNDLYQVKVEFSDITSPEVKGSVIKGIQYTFDHIAREVLYEK